MQESAFVDPPWLIDRRGEGFVQVTELLYRIGEALDGKHTLAEIAEHASQATGRSISVENVQQLVLAQFVKKGLVPLADGRVAAGGTSSRSLLQLNMRVRALDGRSIDPLLQVLRWLFWPPVLALGIGVALALEVWLYFVHGVAAGIHDALYAPGLLLLILLATIASAAFHELGHAAALHYGGGHPRSMGAGLYIVYPAFFTDVSDNYRLGRWARVRTDLGGFYFNLLFSIGLVALYALTGQEVLLLVVSLANLEILRQLMPLMRLDGYWVLADLTGVPDFISHIGGFVRSVMPGQREAQATSARRLPRLKPWASVVFTLYILLAVPLLGLQILAMLQGVPRVLATAWDSAGRQMSVIGQAHTAGDIGGSVLAGLHLCALLLPALAVGFGLSRLARGIVGGVWRWSSPTPARRIIGGLGSLAVVAFLGYSWLPAQPAGSPARAVSGQASYVPIAANERGSVPDMLAGVVATTVPRAPAPTVSVEPTQQLPPPTINPLVAVSPVTSPAPTAPAKPTAGLVISPTVPTPRGTPAPAVSPVPRTPTATPLPRG
jgi:putative peptide zinc metalloprotease protein